MVLLTCAFVNCSNSDEPDPVLPEPDPEPESPNKALSGIWSRKGVQGYWVINNDGEVKDVMIHHIFVTSSLDINRDSVIVNNNGEFNIDFLPEKNTITVDKGGVKSVADVETMESSKIVYKDQETDEVTTMKKRSDYNIGAPESIEGFLLCASRFKVHGIVFGQNNKLSQYFYYDAIIDYPEAKYTYTKGEGNKATLKYDLTYRINPEKVKIYTGNMNVNLDVTFEYHGELEMEFWGHAYPDDPKSTFWLGEFDGKVHSKVTNNRTGAVTVSVIEGKKLFALEVPED